MPSGLAALLDDVATIAKLAAASVDDIGAAAGRAGMKAAGVVIDDTAVTPRYVTGLSPAREIPIIAKIARGSLFNKLVILLPAALLLSAFAPWAIIPLLMIGGAFLAYEATHKIWEKLSGHDHTAEELVEVTDPGELEDRQVKGAIRTDFILSAEIMAIALAEVEANSIAMQAGILAAVAVAITVGVYGLVAIIVKLDDIGLHLAERGPSFAQRFGRGLVHVVPKLLAALAAIGTAAMLWVGGQILLHGLEELHIGEAIPHFVHDKAHAVAEGIGFWVPVWEWLLNALGGAVAGSLVGGLIVLLLGLLPGRKNTAAGDAAH
jgi:predicted DNA repair protein MutK